MATVTIEARDNSPFGDPPSARRVGIDAHVINALGLPPTVVRIPAAQIGCAGGAWAAATAWEHLAVFPDHKVLIISAAAFSNGLHPSDTTTAGFIYRGLAGDGVFACIAAADVSGPGLLSAAG